MLQRISIPDLSGGVSRQPDGQRFPNQVEECDNAFLHMTAGLEKRAGFEMVKDIADLPGNMHVHWIDRTPTDRYVVIFRNDATTPVSIRKIDGTACTITWVDAAAKTYATGLPADIRTITIDDTTLVVNTSVTTAFDASVLTYNFDGTAVDSQGNAHNVGSWEEFDLPPQNTNEYWYAKDDALGHPAGWYKSISTTTQPWYERVRTPMANSAIDAATMPIRLLQTGPTTFEGRLCSWNPRYSGDSLTNPGPSFVGKKITDICVHRNRMWLSAGENVVGSASGQFYNFWLDSYASVIDSDPIDVKLSSSMISSITWMSPFYRSIVVFTNSGQQYEITAREALTPSSVNVTPSTTFTSPKTRPVVLGTQLYWPADKGPFSQVYEYIISEGSVTTSASSYAADIASHVDGYLPSQAAEIKGSTSSDMLFLRKGTTIYANFMFWQGQKKMQNAWTKWSPAGVDEILGFHVFDDKLYVLNRIITAAATTLRIDRMPLRNNDAVPSYAPRMDCVSSVTGTYSGSTKLTTFTVPFNADNLDTVYLGPAWGNQEGSRYAIVSCTPVGIDQTTVTVSAKIDGTAAFIGKSFEFNAQLSKQYVRDQNGVPAVGALQVKQCSIHNRNTGYFTFVVDPNIIPSSVRIMKFTGKQLGSIGFITNENVLSDKDIHHFKVMGSARTIEMSIKSDSPAPVNVTGLEFTVDFVPAKRSAASN